eukprot:4020460-Amphidinium_carterae.2
MHSWLRSQRAAIFSPNARSHCYVHKQLCPVNFLSAHQSALDAMDSDGNGCGAWEGSSMLNKVHKVFSEFSSSSLEAGVLGSWEDVYKTP